ncbi:MAG: class I tRNA ligase family protein, partial [Candidatus Hodarchaeales archaeon]
MKCNNKQIKGTNFEKEQDRVYIVTAAWPTINSLPHLGTILQLLSADVITRYLRRFGKKAIAVTGSDAHGTPILIAANH